MAAVRHLELFFLTAVLVRNPFCIILPNFAKLGHTTAEKPFFDCSNMAAAAILDFKKLEILAVDPV